jgi:hypothetical protein
MGVAMRLAVAGSLLLAQGPAPAGAQSVGQLRKPKCGCLAETKVVTFYEGASIPANIGISSGTYTLVDGYRYINIFVEFEQETATEAPVSLGVIFGFDAGGKHGSRHYFTFEDNFAGTADPQMITLSGAGSWHGSPHNKSSYNARLPIMGPYVQVFPFNHEGKARKFSIVAYLTN